MSARKLVTAVAVLSVMGLTAPSWAQHARGGQSRGHAVQRAAPQGQSHAAPPAQVAPVPRPQPGTFVAPRGAVPRTAPPYQGRYYGRPGYPSYSYPPHYAYPRSYSYSRPYSYGGHYYYGGPRYYGRPGPYVTYARPYYYPRPYYSFRPWFSIGFGISVGFPVAYPPYAYVSPYPAPSPVPYGYGTVVATPGAAAYGGVSFQITPPDAIVYVDGNFVGPASYFGPNAQPLTLTPGQHHIEVQAQGYQPIAIDVHIVPGQVIPYQGAMLPY